jgi:hypothetical protein
MSKIHGRLIMPFGVPFGMSVSILHASSLGFPKYMHLATLRLLFEASSAQRVTRICWRSSERMRSRVNVLLDCFYRFTRGWWLSQFSARIITEVRGVWGVRFSVIALEHPLLRAVAIRQCPHCELYHCREISWNFKPQLSLFRPAWLLVLLVGRFTHPHVVPRLREKLCNSIWPCTFI